MGLQRAESGFQEGLRKEKYVVLLYFTRMENCFCWLANMLRLWG